MPVTKTRRPQMTYALAHAASMDTGNRSMRAAGRTAWNEDDYNVSVKEFDRLFPDPYAGERFRLVNRESGAGDQTPPVNPHRIGMASKKTFHTQNNIGKVKYTVSFHDGVKTHADGSPFFDLRTFSNKKRRNKFCKGLRAQGYAETGAIS